MWFWLSWVRAPHRTQSKTRSKRPRLLLWVQSCEQLSPVLSGALSLTYPAAPGLCPTDRPPPFALKRSFIFRIMPLTTLPHRRSYPLGRSSAADVLKSRTSTAFTAFFAVNVLKNRTSTAPRVTSTPRSCGKDKDKPYWNGFCAVCRGTISII